MKKHLSLFLALLLVSGMLTIPALATETDDELARTQAFINDKGISFSQEPLRIEPYTVTWEGYATIFALYVVPVGTVITGDGLMLYYTRDAQGNGIEDDGDVGTYVEDYAYLSPFTITRTDRYYMFGITSMSGDFMVKAEGGASTTTPAAALPANSSAYVVKAGDTLGQIALNNYGSYGYHKALYNANAAAFRATGGRLNAGMTIGLPDTLSGVNRFPAPTLAEGETLYTVKAGDTLGAIARATYGDVMKYTEIFERNSDKLKNANLIYEGQIIVLPAK